MANLTIQEKSDLIEVYSVLQNRDFISIINNFFSVRKSYFIRLLKKFKGL